jgi:Zn-dependent peptidase ImmA (M78 family)
MSVSSLIKIEFIKQIDAKDKLEARTWAELKIEIGSRIVTRVCDRNREAIRHSICVPLFPIAQWIVENWWSLLNEPSRLERIPGSSAALQHLPWIKRHCLRTADSALLLPNLYLFNDGQGVTATWEKDYDDAIPHMPAFFIDYGQEFITYSEANELLATLVEKVLQRVHDVDDERVRDLASHWDAIKSADQEEVSFCVTAARMGLNPYDRNEISDNLAEAICSLPSDSNIPINRDLAEAAKAEAFVEQLAWMQAAKREFSLHETPSNVIEHFDLEKVQRLARPHEYGYSMARLIRKEAGIAASDPIDSIEKVSQAVSGQLLRRMNYNHLPGKAIQGIVGWSDDNSAVVAGPEGRNETNRFFLARGLFHALYSCDISPRLVTQAITWDQSASRAFAAELLAPQRGLAALVGDADDDAEIEHLAERYQVSPRVVELQLGNVGVPIS